MISIIDRTSIRSIKMEESYQINIRINKETMDNITKYIQELNDKNSINLTPSGAVKSIIKQFFKNTGK